MLLRTGLGVEPRRLNSSLEQVGPAPEAAVSWCVIDAVDVFNGMFCCSSSERG